MLRQNNQNKKKITWGKYHFKCLDTREHLVRPGCPHIEILILRDCITGDVLECSISVLKFILSPQRGFLIISYKYLVIKIILNSLTIIFLDNKPGRHRSLWPKKAPLPCHFRPP